MAQRKNLSFMCIIRKSTTNKDLLLIGDGDENYMAKIYPFTIIRYTMEGMGITPAEEHIEKYKRAYQFRYKIFVPFLAFGQLTTGNKRAQVIPLKQGIENNDDLDFLQPKSTNEIVVFDLKNSLNLNAYLKTISTDLSPDLTPWQKAFNVMNLFHIIGCKIGHSYARNAVILKGPDIRWMDASGFDKFSSLAGLAKNPDDILVANFKKLLDVTNPIPLRTFPFLSPLHPDPPTFPLLSPPNSFSFPTPPSSSLPLSLLPCPTPHLLPVHRIWCGELHHLGKKDALVVNLKNLQLHYHNSCSKYIE